MVPVYAAEAELGSRKANKGDSSWDTNTPPPHTHPFRKVQLDTP